MKFFDNIQLILIKSEENIDFSEKNSPSLFRFTSNTSLATSFFFQICLFPIMSFNISYSGFIIGCEQMLVVHVF